MLLYGLSHTVFHVLKLTKYITDTGKVSEMASHREGCPDYFNPRFHIDDAVAPAYLQIIQVYPRYPPKFCLPKESPTMPWLICWISF